MFHQSEDQPTLDLVAENSSAVAGSITKPVSVLNLYAGLGGNRKLWKNVEVVAVEHQEDIAELYQDLHPSDTVIVGDAHEYLEKNHQDFDFIWSSPPCQSHSKMDKANYRNKPRYADLKLYEEIIFLQSYFNGKWVVENVDPYYKQLIPGRLVGRHMFWSNFFFSNRDVKRPASFINQGTLEGVKLLKEWLGIHFEKNVYYAGNHCPAQILRNCVHPLVGEHIFNSAYSNHH